MLLLGSAELRLSQMSGPVVAQGLPAVQLQLFLALH